MRGLPGTDLKSREYMYIEGELRHKLSWDGRRERQINR